MFSEHHLKLTQAQKNQIAKAAQSGSSVKLRFKHSQLKNGPDKMLLSQRQINKINKSHQTGKGCEIVISKTQMDKMKKGGLIAALLPALVGAVAPWLLGKLFPDRQQQQAQGIVLPRGGGYNNPLSMEGDGIVLPGMKRGKGVIKADNGGPISEHVYGKQSHFLPNESDPYGSGMLIPGQKKRQVKVLEPPRLNYGMGFVAPNSPDFQMLK